MDGNSVQHSSFIRNIGIFWEGGAYQYFLNIALIFSLYVKKNPVFSFPNWILVISIITTFSTTGYLIMAVVLASIVMGKSSKRMFFVKTLIMIPLILSVLFSPVIFNKLFDTDSREYQGSTSRRILDTVIDSTIIKDYPALGIGLGNQEIWESYSAQLSGGTSSSNGLTNYLAKMGLLGFLITLYPFMWFRFKNKMNQMILLCNILSILAQNIMLTPIFLLSMSLLNQKRSSKPLLPRTSTFLSLTK
jgi:O-antigen ligase